MIRPIRKVVSLALSFMLNRSKESTSTKSEPEHTYVKATYENISEAYEDCNDLTEAEWPNLGIKLMYFGHLIDQKRYELEIFIPLENAKADDIKSLLNHSRYVLQTDSEKVIAGIFGGDGALFYKDEVYLVDLYGPSRRNITTSETETVIVGPHDAFSESSHTNLSLIRRKLKSNRLKVKEFKVGEVTKNHIYVLYLDGIANKKHVDTMCERVEAIETGAIYDGHILAQYIEDNPNSVFPNFLTTERPDVAVSKLFEGRVLAIVEESPSIICGPTSFFDFFTSPDDYYNRWSIGTATRVLRYTAFVITMFFTAFYVAITTFHYEMIPQNLLLPLTSSRARVPFPPVIEALLMETTIELLREAGARLPNKIGQTIGIVGGIVIGQAAVQAGLTSNILIIAVASSAIASFVIPSYVMSASIRLVRFGLIILSGFLGNFGLVIGLALFIIHLSNMKSLGAPYTIPAAPLKPADWKDVFIRGPFWMLKKRPTQAIAKNSTYNRMKK